MDILEEIAGKVQTGKNKDVKTLCLEAMEEGIPAEVILNQGLLEGMTAASEQFRKGDILITHVLLAAGAMNVGTKVLQQHYPYLDPDEEITSEYPGPVVLGTVKGDLHDIGKNMVKLMMESSGISVIDLGVNVDPFHFVEEAIKHDAKIIACSALVTTTMPMLGKVIEAAEKRGIRDKVKIMVGGAPVTREFAKSIGADAYTDNAREAVELAIKYLTEMNEEDD